VVVRFFRLIRQRYAAMLYFATFAMLPLPLFTWHICRHAFHAARLFSLIRHSHADVITLIAIIF